MRRAAYLSLVLIIALTGCGGGGNKPKPLTKAQYEQKLGPLLNQQVAPAVRAALANGGILDPSKVTTAIASVKTAHDQMASVTPPTAVADLHKRAVAVLAALVTDMTKLRDAETKKDTSAERGALTNITTDARGLVDVGSQFTSRGF